MERKPRKDSQYETFTLLKDVLGFMVMVDSDDLMDGEAVIEIVENQLAENNPPRVKETLMRLMLEGVDREEAVQYIACALCVELVDVVNHQAAFNVQRYNNNLDALPEMPWAEDL